MRSTPEKSRALYSIYAQMFFIIIAFVIMGISSFLFVSHIEHRHLIKDAENILSFTEMEIVSTLLEPEIFLSGYSETIRSMLLSNETEATVSEYMKIITNFMLTNGEYSAWLKDTHGYFFKWDKHLSGKNWAPPSSANIRESSWFQKAIEAQGRIVVSDIDKDSETGNSTLTFSRYITDNEGNPLAIICLALDLNRIYRRVVSINLTENSYGILLNNKLDILTHPEPYIIGQKLYNINSGLALLANELEMGMNISERKIKNYMYEDSIVYFVKIKYDWFLGIVIPVNEYYKSLNNMAMFLIILGALLSWILCTMFYYITQAKRKSDMRTQQKSNFLATMSHEIRTPLNAILGITDIQMQNAVLNPSISEAFIKINNSGNLLLNIINDILDLSKIEVGKLELVPVKYKTANLINDIIQINYIRYESKPIKFTIDIDENIPSSLIGDELRIKQILNNILSNAFKYTDQGEVALKVYAECVGRGSAVIVTLVFEVKDTGQGMTTEQIGKLYDEYTRFNMEANRTTEGAGLGMTITRNLVNLMYGKINVKSTVGEGTLVNIRLPQKTDGIGISGVIGKEIVESLRQFKLGNIIQLKKNQVIQEYMPYGHVLIVDDVETNLYVAQGLMSPYGLKIELAESGFEALDKVKNGAVYDIIFMDHMMPKMDGIETTKQLRKMGYTNPVVALTANALAGHAEMFLSNGFDDFVSKPIDIRQLNVTLNKLIRDKQSVEVLDAAQKEKAEFDKKIEAGQGIQQVDLQLAKIFARDAKKAVAVIKACMQNNLGDEGNVQMYIINVHAMKSALLNIGEKELSSVALRLEQAGREKNINVISIETVEFLDNLEMVIKRIDKVEEEEHTEGTEDSPDALAFLDEKLQIIKKACTEMDKKTAKTVLTDLRSKTWSRQTGTLINSIAEHLLHSDFDEAATLIDSYKK